MTELIADPAILEDALWRSVHKYHNKWDEDIPISHDDLENVLRVGEPVNLEEIYDYIDSVSKTYEDLLDVNSSLNEEFKKQVKYNRSCLETFSDSFNTIGIGTAIIQSSVLITFMNCYPGTLINSPEEIFVAGSTAGILSAFAINRLFEDGTYFRESINISTNELEGPSAFWSTAAETYHAFQHHYNSPTLNDPLLLEGSERALTAKALESQASETGEDKWEKASDAFRTHVLTNGYRQYLEFTEDVPTIYPLVELGLSPEEADDTLSYSNPDNIEYNFGASLILAHELLEDEIYKEVFHGEIEDYLDEYRDQLSFLTHFKYR